MKRHRYQISAGLLILMCVLLHALNIITLPFTENLELWSYDLRLRATMPGGVDNRIVIVDIDEKSLAEQGRWPWNRKKIAGLVESLMHRYQVTAVGFDVVFAEEDRSSGIDVLSALAENELKGDTSFRTVLARYRRELDYDAVMARAIRGQPVILGYTFNDGIDHPGSGSPGMLPRPVFTGEELKGLGNAFLKMAGYGANIPVLQENAASAGHFLPAVDRDGVTRRVPLLVEYNGAYYESLSLAILRVVLGSPGIDPGVPPASASSGKRLEWLTVAGMKIPVDDQVTALIPYRGAYGSFRYVSATDVIKGTVGRDTLEGAVVIVGTTAAGLMDLRSTPVSPVYPGVEIHASMIAGMLDGTIRHAPYYARGAEVVAVLAAGLLLALLLPLLTPVKAILLMVLTSAAVIAGAMAAWYQGLVLPLASLIVLIPVLFIFNMTWGFLAEARSRRYITGLFGQYVPPQIVAVMSRDPERFTMQAEEREMTVLFSDIVGFTGVSEQLSPRELSALINEFLTVMTGIIYNHGGTVDKYIGDAIMAFWGAPLSDADHAAHAVQAALAMQREMENFRALCRTRGWPELQIGIGVNTGGMRIGNMGSRYRVSYTVMGDAVNLASRLEGLTRLYGNGVLVGADTLDRLPGGLASRQIDLVTVKGKHLPVAIYEPLDDSREPGRSILNGAEIFTRARQHYRELQWDQAERLFSRFLESCPDDTVSRLYLERIRHYRGSPPPEQWDGVYSSTSK